MSVEKVREQLRVTPWELVFSGVRGAPEITQGVSVRNMVDEVVEIRAITLRGEGAGTFALRDLPSLPVRVAPRAWASWQVAFAPPATAEPGVHRALVRVQTGPEADDGPAVDLAALVARGEQGENEPPLQHVMDALGFAVDVGGRALKLGTSAAPIGDEVPAPLFRRAKPGAVALHPVARYSPVEPLPFGYYVPGAQGGEPTRHDLGVIVAAQAQTLNPEVEAGGRTSFEPGDATFGVWVRSGKHVTYTEDARNTGPTRHAARVYPLKARGGAPVADAYVVAFEEAQNGDYQDYVFILWNVSPASPPAR
jgi:hypothetical protein